MNLASQFLQFSYSSSTPSETNKQGPLPVIDIHRNKYGNNDDGNRARKGKVPVREWYLGGYHFFCFFVLLSLTELSTLALRLRVVTPPLSG